MGEVGAEWQMLRMRVTMPFRRLWRALRKRNDAARSMNTLTTLSEWDRTEKRGDWAWVSPKAREDRAVTCPNAATHGCLDLWAPDLFNEFAGVCAACGHHFPMEFQWMMHNCFDSGSLFEFNAELESANPLGFPGMDQLLATARKNTGLKSACITFEARVKGIQTVAVILAASFRGGSVGAAEGAKFVAAAERARRKRYPLIVYCHGTAGIRIQEGTHGLIQMPRCTVAVQRYVEAGGLYLVIYDTQSYGGPIASFLGCASYQFAIRSSNIGFAGPAVIRNTSGYNVPPNYHNCYKALSRGHIQGVWDRRDLRANINQALLTMGGRNLYYR
jgi:acetyl-CoA carboxylase carboxyl transferase subunit beta